METRKNIAAEKKRCNSHNCAQAILHTYADIAGVSEDEAMNIAGAFGGGMGNMEGTCGALVGAGLVLGGTKVVLRECPDCVADAAEFLEEQLNG